MNTDKPTTAVGHMFYNSGWMDPSDVLGRVGSELDDGGFTDYEDQYGGTNFKVTITVEQL